VGKLQLTRAAGLICGGVIPYNRGLWWIRLVSVGRPDYYSIRHRVPG